MNLGTLATSTDSPPIQFRSFYILKHSITYSETDPVGTGFTMKLLLPSSTSHQIAYGLSNSSVLCMSLGEQDEPDKIDFGSGGITDKLNQFRQKYHIFDLLIFLLFIYYLFIIIYYIFIRYLLIIHLFR